MTSATSLVRVAAVGFNLRAYALVAMLLFLAAGGVGFKYTYDQLKDTQQQLEQVQELLRTNQRINDAVNTFRDDPRSVSERLRQGDF